MGDLLRVTAPGRTEIAGNHTDHEGGHVIAAAINRYITGTFELRDDGEYEQTHEFICSTGVGNSTPRGVFLNGFPANYWHHFEKFDCWAKYSFEIEGDIMFHSVIFNANDESTVRMNSVYALGSKASHGCIRLKVEDAKWLFEHCKRGKLIIVIY